MSRGLLGFLAIAPSTVAVGERFELKLKALGKPHPVDTAPNRAYPRLVGPFNTSPRGIQYMDNAVERWRGELVFDGGSALEGPTHAACKALKGAFAGDERAIGTVPGFAFTRPGAYTIRVADRASGLDAVTNAIEVLAGPAEHRLYWGDLHSQTFLSDGLRIPEELCHFARHEAFLDIFALSDHAEYLTDAQWRYFTQVSNGAYQPGRFVTINGFEWSNSEVGHRNLYYPGAGGPLIRYTDNAGSTLERLYATAAQHGALIVPHHSANATMGVDWDTPHEATHVRLVEVYSIWGNSERPAQEGNPRPIRNYGGEMAGRHVLDALDRGFRLGFVGGGDIHDGRPGDDLHRYQPRPENYKNLWRQGLMGVWAKTLTREGIWEALWNRRVYATTNVRVILRFEVCGKPMGMTVAAGPRRPIRVHALSEEPIARVDIVRNGRDAHVLYPDEHEVDWAVQDTSSEPTYYYARLTRADGEMAWSSPVWVQPEGARRG